MSYTRRVILNTDGNVVYNGELDGKGSCCACLTVACCTCCGCCKPKGNFPPVRESAFTRVTNNAIVVNRPYFYPKMEYRCGGCCVKKKGGACPLQDFEVEDRINIYYFDQWTQAKVETPSCSCFGDKFVVLQHPNSRWTCCIDGYRIFDLKDPKAFAEAANDQRKKLASEIGTFKPEGYCIPNVKDNVPFNDEPPKMFMF